MPELPEVETVRRQLARELPERRIQKCRVRLARLVTYPSVSAYCRMITGKRIESVGRRGKYIIFVLEQGLELVIHLGMTGSFSFLESKAAYPKHAHIVYYLDDGRRLIYVDPRTFGETALLPSDDRSPLKGLANIGIEPLEEDFTAERLKASLAGTALIKAALLDQRRIAGIGNIYADEILHRAGIHPRRRLNELSGGELERLHRCIGQVLSEAIKGRGSTIIDFADLEGEKGGFQDELKVYGRSGEPCMQCGAAIEKTRVAGRGTHYCPNCQK
jgi:formamidopyrimidine-DNA glycosylase